MRRLKARSPEARSPPAPARPQAPRSEARVTEASGRSILIGLAAFALFFYAVRVILLPFVLAGVAAYVLGPAVDWLTGRLGGCRWLAVLLTLVALIGLAGTLAMAVVPSALHAALNASDNLESLLERLFSTLTDGTSVSIAGRDISPHGLSDLIITKANQWLADEGRGFMLASWGFSTLAGMVLALVVFTYFLASGAAFGRGFFALVPPLQRAVCERIWAGASPVLRRYFLGIVAVVVYASIAAYIGLGLFLHLPDALLLALMSGLFEMIPVVGPIAAAVIAGLAVLQTDTGTPAIIAYIVYAVALRFSVDEVVGPLVLGKASRINPAVVIFCFLAGGLLFGIAGLIMSVPVALLIKVALGVLYDEADGARQREENA